MRLIGILLASFSLLVPIRAFACGSWVLSDRQARREISFQVESLRLVDPAKPDPRFMRAYKDKAYLISGDRLALVGEDVVLRKRVEGGKASGRAFEARKLGTWKEGVLVLGEGRRYVISLEGARISVRNGAALEADGAIPPGCDADVKSEVRRVALYLAWKSLSLDPYAKPAENWWW